MTNVHLPGYDGSPFQRPYRESDTLEALEETLLGAGVVDPVFVGYSFGAFRALHLAQRGRFKVKALVSLAGFFDLSEAHRNAVVGSAQAVRDRSVDLSTFSPHFLSPTGMNHPEWVAEVQTWFSVVSRDNLAEELEAAAVAAQTGVDMASLSFPILARVGDGDVAVPKAYSESLVAKAPSARLEVVEGVGHALMLEDRDGTVNAVQAFLRQLQ